MSLKFIVMSDIHLMPPGGLSMGLDTAARLRKAIETVVQRYDDIDFCILAGDLADLGQQGAYEQLQDLLVDMPVPVHMTLGNHDNRETFLQVFGDAMANPQTRKVDRVIDVKGYRIIILDTSEPDLVAGRLSDVQIEWLTARLAEAASQPVIVVMHHHASLLNTHADRIALLAPEAFLQALKTHPDVRQVIAGHVHVTSCAVWQGVPFCTLAGGHYSVGFDVGKPDRPVECFDGPGQFAVVEGTADRTTVLFDDFLNNNQLIHTHVK
ncbi:Ser/Thr protein phosphatase [Ketogulonicigenium robustum]|uniref:Ser/Thr protein phosphatase n=1 Tax=Ketogulonicigenium robustum TaxID=92947 RepID=A0A1W6NX42_9RHOB|nr:metallophosphoesterase [Ketogulonicigenium robustum]ARO13816.1 Ser/Thr protein phosphatase [Ketogulonicigenium robustum]